MRHYNVSIYLSSTRDPKDLESEINVMLDERITDFDTKIQISDIHVEEVIDDNTMSLSETDGETDASRNA